MGNSSSWHGLFSPCSLNLYTQLSVSLLAVPWHTSVLASCWLLLWQAGKSMKRLGHIALYSLFQGVYTNINRHLPSCMFWLARLICTLSDKVAAQLSIILSIPFPFSPSLDWRTVWTKCFVPYQPPSPGMKKMFVSFIVSPSSSPPALIRSIVTGWHKS